MTAPFDLAAALRRADSVLARRDINCMHGADREQFAGDAHNLARDIHALAAELERCRADRDGLSECVATLLAAARETIQRAEAAT